MNKSSLKLISGSDQNIAECNDLRKCKIHYKTSATKQEIHAALKLIELLFIKGEIPRHVYRNICNDDNGTFYCANDKSKGYNLMHLNALYDLLNRRYMDAVLQDSRDKNENKALISIIENTHYHSAIGFNYRLS